MPQETQDVLRAELRLLFLGVRLESVAERSPTQLRHGWIARDNTYIFAVVICTIHLFFMSGTPVCGQPASNTEPQTRPTYMKPSWNNTLRTLGVVPTFSGNPRICGG